jgi:hypothetical protein
MAEQDPYRDLQRRMADQAVPVGTRVRHIDQQPPVDGRLLPMHGTVVAIEMHYLVEWDQPESDSPLLFGEQSTFKYPAECNKMPETTGIPYHRIEICESFFGDRWAECSCGWTSTKDTLSSVRRQISGHREAHSYDRLAETPEDQ